MEDKRCTITEITVPETGHNTPVRVFAPTGEGPFPVLFFFHAGGFTQGSYDMDYGLSRQLCREAGCVVVGVDYLLAPAHPWPAAHNEADAVIRAVLERAKDHRIDPQRVAVGGSSAGGNLAAGLCVRAWRERAYAVRFAALVYPPLDLSALPPEPLPPQFDGFITARSTRQMRAAYLPAGVRAEDPLLSPLYADPAAFPPLCLAVGDRDVLAEDAQRFADRLRGAGKRVRLELYRGAGHAFLEAPGQEQVARDCRRMLAEELREWISEGE